MALNILMKQKITYFRKIKNFYITFNIRNFKLNLTSLAL